jgi:crystallin alpha B
MSHVPLLLDDMLNDLRRPVSVFDQHFGLGILPEDLLDQSVVGPIRIGYYRPWRSQAARHSGRSNIQRDKEGFKVST